VIPFGTGGDFRRTVHMPTELAEAARVIAANHRRKIDVGRLELTTPAGGRVARMFANIASFGVSGVVDRLVNQSSKRLGRLAFAVATARATWSYKNQRVQLVFDGAERIEATINTVAVANGRYFGGAMMVAPNAELDDGMFDVVAMGDFGFGDLLKSGRRLYKGTHLTMDKVTARRARVVEAEPIDPKAIVELDIDGENPGRLPARFALVSEALWLIVPGAPGASATTAERGGPAAPTP
jgi:diacylglycerol kinase family enzyme